MIKRSVDETRRRFLALIGLSPIVAAGGTSERTHSRFYKANNGHQGVTYCDGAVVEHAVSCKTGRNGWVKYFVIKNNAPVFDYRRGSVEFRPSTPC